MNKFLAILIFILISQMAYSQKDTSLTPIDTFDSKIEIYENGDIYAFKSILRPLVQVPGGRTPYYKYLWDFGDGNFSNLPEPTHQYAKPGNYEVSVYAVNNYDDGPKPKKPKRTIQTSKSSSLIASTNSFQKNFFSSNGIFQIFKLSDAKPGEDLNLVVGINHEGRKGKIYILTNEKIAGLNGFELANESNYYSEQKDSLLDKSNLTKMWSSVTQSTFTKTGSPDYGITEISQFKNQHQAVSYFQELYGAYNSLTAYDIDPTIAEQQFKIINMDVTDDMLVDTNAIVTITGIFIPEDGIASVHQVDIPVVKSHDPNKMSIRPARMNYRFQKKRKTMTYKVQFQNDGEGDAKNVRLEMKLPLEVVKETFKLKALYPECDTCKNSNSRGCYQYYVKDDGTFVFHFKDISLPGTASKNITDMDSTKGFILFEVETQKKLKNKSFKAYTDIYFDKNEPIRTNTATTRFRKTLSPIITLGASKTFGTPSENTLKHKFGSGYQLGFGLAPTAPYKRPYWQAEIYTSYFSRKSETDRIDDKGVIEINDEGRISKFEYQFTSENEKREYVSIQIPLQIRYNLNPYFSLGIGIIGRKDINISYSANKSFIGLTQNAEGNIIENQFNEEKILSKENSTIKYNPFVDFNIGGVQLGPAFGIRLSYDKNQKSNAGIYGIMRF